MKRMMMVTGAAIALALAASSPSFAQGVGVQVGPVGAGITFAPEQRTRIKEYVVKEKVRPVTVREQVRVGTKLPADVELHDVPSDWGPSVTRYKYIYAGDRVHFVDPASREVIYDID